LLQRTTQARRAYLSLYLKLFWRIALRTLGATAHHSYLLLPLLTACTTPRFLRSASTRTRLRMPRRAFAICVAGGGAPPRAAHLHMCNLRYRSDIIAPGETALSS